MAALQGTVGSVRKVKGILPLPRIQGFSRIKKNQWPKSKLAPKNQTQDDCSGWLNKMHLKKQQTNLFWLDSSQICSPPKNQYFLLPYICIYIYLYLYLYRQGPINGPPGEKLPTEDLCQRFKVAAVEALRCQHWDVAVSWPEKSAQIPYLVANLSVSAWNLCFFPSKRRSNQTRKDWFSWSVLVVFSEVWCLWLL